MADKISYRQDRNGMLQFHLSPRDRFYVRQVRTAHILLYRVFGKASRQRHQCITRGLRIRIRGPPFQELTLSTIFLFIIGDEDW